MKLDHLIDLAKSMNELLELDFEELQPFHYIQRDWPVNEQRIIAGTINRKILNEEKHLRFDTIIPPLAAFPEHWHDCKEVCTIRAGMMGDKLQPGKIWKLGEECIFEKLKKHIPFNPSETEHLHIQVDFYF